jgi:hypothetical protein
MAFGIAKGFGFEAKLQQQLMGKLQGQEEVIRRIIEFAHKLLEDTKGGLVAGVGIVVLFWTVIGDSHLFKAGCLINNKSKILFQSLLINLGFPQYGLERPSVKLLMVRNNSNAAGSVIFHLDVTAFLGNLMIARF